MMAAQTADDLEIVFRLLTLLVLLVSVVLAASDFVFELRGKRSVGQRLQMWSRRQPLFAVALVAVYGAVLSHFFWQEVVVK
jgi:hypothetical protein